MDTTTSTPGSRLGYLGVIAALIVAAMLPPFGSVFALAAPFVLRYYLHEPRWVVRASVGVAILAVIVLLSIGVSSSSNSH